MAGIGQTAEVQHALNSMADAPIIPSDPFQFGTGPHMGKKLRKIQEYITNINAMDPMYEENEKVSIGGVPFDWCGAL